MRDGVGRGASGLLALVIIFLSSSLSFGDLLYDVTFSSPPHVVGQVPAVQYSGTPRLCPTYIVFGGSTVVSSVGALLDQPVHLVPTPTGGGYNYAQFQFNLAGQYGFPTNYPDYHLGMDLFLDHFGANDVFSILVDTEYSVRLDLTGSGTIVRYAVPSGPMIQMGEFPFGAAFSLGLDIDLPRNTWTLAVNQQPTYTGQFYYPTPAHPDLPGSIFSLRLNVADDPNTTSTPDVALDNFTITGIPEPATGVTTVLGVLLLAGWRWSIGRHD